MNAYQMAIPDNILTTHLKNLECNDTIFLTKKYHIQNMIYDRHNRFIKINSNRMELLKILRPILGTINSIIKIEKTINPIIDNIHKINSLTIFIGFEILCLDWLSATNNN